MIADMMLFARPPQLELAPLELTELVGESRRWADKAPVKGPIY